MQAEKRGYLAGPIESAGDMKANLETFHAAADRLRDKGWIIHNPAENFKGATMTRVDHQRVNLPTLTRFSGSLGNGMDLDAVLVLPGWEQSDGAKLEVAMAYELGLPVLDAGTLKPIATPVTLIAGPAVIDMGAMTAEEAEQCCLESRTVSIDLTDDQEAIVAIFDEAKRVALKKNHDYGSSVFEPPVLSPTMPPGAAILVRMSDKINRLQTLLSGKRAQVEDEASADTMLDLATYAFLWLIHQRRTALAEIQKSKP